MARNPTAALERGTDPETLSPRLTRLRKARGLTQTELAHRLGTIQAVVSDYESERRRIHVARARAIAAILQVTADELLGWPTTSATGSGPGELSLKLVRRLKGIEALPPARQKAVLPTLDFLLKGAGS